MDSTHLNCNSKRKLNKEKEIGRPIKRYKDRSDRTKRQDIAVLCNYLQEFPYEMVIGAVIKLLKESDVESHKKISKVIKQLVETPNELDEMVAKFNSVSKPPFLPLNPGQALGMLMDANLSKSQYLKVREASSLTAGPLFPSYDRVRIAKMECRPPLEQATITETSASYSLESLSVFTTKRIIKMQEKVIFQNQRAKSIKSEICFMTYSCGCDGSSGHQNYKQNYGSQKFSAHQDSSIFATTLIPLRLENASKVVYWNNQTPQSVRFCRPLKLTFEKETQQLILNEKRSLEEQIQLLKDCIVDLGEGHSVTVKFRFYLSVIDGKVLSVFTNTKSSQACPICKCTPNDFNNRDNIKNGKFSPKPGSLKYGISPLHCYIRSMEWLLHLSYKLYTRKWQARSAEKKESVKTRKKAIQAKLWDQLALRVDFPNSSGSGTSNDGNTARRAFQNHIKFAEILEIDVSVVNMTRIILLTLNCQLPVDPDKFKDYCYELYAKYLDLYEFYKLPASIHKVLIHGCEIIEASSLPMGMLGEEGAESRNKLYKFDRNYHARKSSRLNTMFDMFFRAIDSSDPILSSLSLSTRINSRSKRESLPSDVIKLLEVPTLALDLTSTSNDLTVDECDPGVDCALDDIVLTNECSNEDDV